MTSKLSSSVFYHAKEGFKGVGSAKWKSYRGKKSKIDCTFFLSFLFLTICKNSHQTENRGKKTNRVRVVAGFEFGLN